MISLTQSEQEWAQNFKQLIQSLRHTEREDLKLILTVIILFSFIQVMNTLHLCG